MQAYKGQYLQVFSALQDYGNDLLLLGRKTATQLIKEAHSAPLSRDPFLPRLALVLFTQTEQKPGGGTGESLPALKQLCAGINEGLGHWGVGEEPVPLVGCSVASIPDIESHRIHKWAFSLTLLVARKRDFEVQIGSSSGFVEEENGHERAWSECLRKVDEQNPVPGTTDGGLPDNEFVLAFFPGRVEGVTDFRTLNLASYRYLRSRINADVPIYGAGAGEFRTPLQNCQIMAGQELIPNGYVCAKVRTTLRFNMSMDHSLKMAPEVLIIKELKEVDCGRSIVSFAVPPKYETEPAPKVLEEFREKYKTQRFAFRAVEFRDDREDLFFMSVYPGNDSLNLIGPIQENTLIRVAFANVSEPVFSRRITNRLPEDMSIAVVFSLTCHGLYWLLGSEGAQREATVLQAEESKQTPGYSVVSGFVFGEWGLGPDLNGQAQNYHSTRLAIADELTPRHHQRRQLEVIDRCSREMYAALLRAEEQSADQRLTARKAAAVLADPLFEAIVDLGYEGGLISLVNEIDQTLVGAEACGEGWRKLAKITVVRLDERDILAQVYRDSFCRQMECHIADSSREPSCPREARAGIVSQTVLPLWDGRRCLGTLQVGHLVKRTELPDHERNALSAIARMAALHLGRIKAQRAIRDLEEGVRYAVSCDDQEKGWCHLAQVAAQAIEVPFCLIRVLDRTRSFLKLVGGSQGLFDLTRSSGRTFTSISEDPGPVVKWFRSFSSQTYHAEPSTEVHVVQDSSRDPGLRVIAGTGTELSSFYQRIGSYALGALVSPQHGLVGVISFLSTRPEFFTPERTEWVRKIAADASIVAKVYKSVTREQLMLQTTFALTTSQTQVDHLLRSTKDFKADFEGAARLLVAAVVNILPCEACTLHRFEEGRYLRLQAAAPEEKIHNKREWDLLKPEDHGFLLHLATQRDVYRAAGKELRSHPRIRVKSGVWSWLPKTNRLHSILAIPLADPDGRRYGILTLYNHLNEEGAPDDTADFTDVPTRVSGLLQEIATHVLESLEVRSRFARLAELAEEFQGHVDSYVNSQTFVNADRVFCHLAASLAKWLDAQICSIFLVRHPEKQLVLRGCVGWVAGEPMLHRAFYETGEGLTGKLVQHPEPVVIANIFGDLRRSGKYFTEMYGPPEPERTYEMIALPLSGRHDDAPLGIITLHRKLPRDYAHLLGFSERNDFALKLASHLARLAVAAIAGEPQTEEALEHERPAIAEILSVAAKERLHALDHNQLAERIAEHFKAQLCGIFLTVDQDPNIVVLSGASSELKRYADKIRIEKHDGPIGEALGSRTTQFRDLPEECSYMGSLDQALRDCLKEPVRNLMAAPMCLGEECGGVTLLVNRPLTSRGEQRAKALRKYNLEALGTGILLMNRHLELSTDSQIYQEAIAERLTAAKLSSAAQNLGHEAGNRLQDIVSCLRMLGNPEASAEERQKCLATIESTYESLATNLDQLQEIIRHAGAAERVDISDVVRRAVGRHGGTAEKHNIHLVNEVGEQLFVFGGRAQFIDVVSTILENAIEACKGRKGEVHIVLDRSSEDKVVGLSIYDNGIGIAPENQKKMFRRDFTTKTKDRKTHGYGLNAAKIMMLMHGGDIEFKSSPGCGTCMTVWFREEG